jgi:hypothetical protein
MTRRADLLRAKYRSRLDAYQILSRENDRLIQNGQQPSREQLERVREAAAAVEAARGELLADLSRGDY